MHTAHLSRLHTGAPAPPQIWCNHTYTGTYRHTQSKTHICLCTCGVGGFESATGRWVGRLCVGASICWGKCVLTRIFVFECEGSHVLVWMFTHLHLGTHFRILMFWHGILLLRNRKNHSGSIMTSKRKCDANCTKQYHYSYACLFRCHFAVYTRIWPLSLPIPRHLLGCIYI